MVMGVTLFTELVVTVNVAVVAPGATVTLASTCATEVLLLDSDTLAPPVGAGPVKATVPVEELPAVTLIGFNASDDNDTVEPEPLPTRATITASQPSLASVQLVL